MRKGVIFAMMSWALVACNKKETEKVEGTQDSAMVQMVLPILNTIALPEELGECSCKMAASETDFKEGKLLYADDYGNTAYLKINGEDFVFTLDESFDLENFDRKLENERYLLHIKNQNEKSHDGIHTYRGQIKLVDKKTNSTSVIPVYAECGCVS